MTPARRAADARPPASVLAVLNPLVARVLRSPLARPIGGLALLEFDGRRSGRRYEVVVGWHDVGGRPVAFTPAPWRANFAGGAVATVHHRGSASSRRGHLVTDPAQVAGALNDVLASGTAPRSLGLRVPAGHRLTAEEVTALGRAMVRFEPVPGHTPNG